MNRMVFVASRSFRGEVLISRNRTSREEQNGRKANYT